MLLYKQFPSAGDLKATYSSKSAGISWFDKGSNSEINPSPHITLQATWVSWGTMNTVLLQSQESVNWIQLVEYSVYYIQPVEIQLVE